MKAKLAAELPDQYEALQSGRGFVELKFWTSLTLTGSDRQTFLHNFCTNDVKRLTPGESCEAFFTNVKGRMIGRGLVTCRENELVIVGEPNQATKLIEHLDRYIIREDVQLRDTSAARAYLLLCGKPDAAARWFDNSLYATDWYQSNAFAFVVIEAAAADLPKLKEKMAANGLLACDDVFQMVRVEAGIPLFGVDFDESNFPQEVGRDAQAISFTKGCYLGQETVARIDALGHVNQQMAGVRFAGEAQPEIGTELTHDGKSVGRVTSAAFSLRLNAPLALAMLRREQSNPGTRLDSRAGPCEVISLPVD